MGMTEDFETSLQVLRGFDTDISIEVNEIKVNIIGFYYKFTTVRLNGIFYTYGGEFEVQSPLIN